jgi:hypothetical protein
MKLVFEVAPDGREPFQVTATSRDVSKWERAAKGRKLANASGISELEEIAHIACQRHALWHGTIEEFREQCDIDPITPDEDEEPDPTR